MMTSTPVSTIAAWRIIIIEDCLEDREEIRRLLIQGSERRYQFVEAETGAAGVRATLDASGGLPDCVVLDYFLPDFDALEVLSGITGPDGLTVCPVVVLTGSADLRMGQTVLRAGAQDFIGKGRMTTESLTRAVENAAERWAMARELQTRTSALHASQLQLQLAVEVAGLGVNRIDYRTDTIVLDTIAAELFGLNAGVPMPRSATHATFHPDDADEIFRLINLSLDPTGDGCFAMEHRVVHRDGSVRWLAVKKQVTFADVSGIRGPVSGLMAVIDITERKRSAEELQRVNILLDTLLLTAPVGFCFLDRDLRFVRINQRLALINGIPAEAHLGRHISEIVPALLEPLRAVTGRILATGEAVLDHEFSGETPAAPGVMRHWNESWYPLRDAAGEVLGFGGIVEEITARKQAEAQLVKVNENLLVASLRQHELAERAEWLTVQLREDLTGRVAAEEALRESQHFIHSVLYNLFAFVGVMTVDGTVTEANRSSLEAAGISASEVLGKKFWDCYWWSYSPKIQAQLRDACARAAGGEVVRYDVPVRMAGDTRVWIDFQLSPLHDTKGRITHLIPSALEIQVRHAAEEALRESEQRFRVMADGLPLLIWVHDAQGALQFVNQAYREFFDVTPQQIAGPNWHALIHPEDLPAYSSEFSACVRDRRPFFAEVRARRSGGGWRWLESRANPRFDASGEFLGMVGSSPDITERKAAEQELVRHREGLERAVEQRTAELAASTVALHTAERLAALGTLAAGLGHDIANMTMPIRAGLRVLEATCATDENRKDFAGISKSLDHLSNLSAGMRLMALDPDRVDVSTLAEDLEAWCAETTPVWRAAVPRQIMLECKVPRGVGVSIPRHRLAQAVFNLVQNAGEAMADQPVGTVSVTAEAAISAAGAPIIRLHVQDDGPGMPAEVVARCFEPYFSTKGRAIATGMGLGMVRGIVESAGGTAAVRSTPGGGTTFTLTLPAAVAGPSAGPRVPQTAAVSVNSQRESSLAMMFLGQLALKTHRHLGSSVPDVSLWVVEAPAPAQLRQYFENHPEGRVVLLDAVVDSGRAQGRGQEARSERVTVLGPSPSPAALRDAITRAIQTSVPTGPGK